MKRTRRTVAAAMAIVAATTPGSTTRLTRVETELRGDRVLEVVGG
jgi:hypothetical protein